ncbi:hypothetical protein TNCV_1158381 [Trichonephila clavipes]|nr:hypothetical protein TNCV_1158381 [Trichonephila clavipes]
MVQAVISIKCHPDMHAFNGSNVNGQRYGDEILDQCIMSSSAAIGDNFILMEDNLAHIKLYLLTNTFFEWSGHLVRLSYIR